MTRTRIKPDGIAIEKLSKKLLLVFGNSQLVEKVGFFGSLAKGEEDRFSDLDLQILVSDFENLSRNIYKILGKVGKPYVVFPVKNLPGDVVLTILWKNFSFYQKLDLRITSKQKRLEGSPLKLDFNEDLRPFYDFFIGVTRYVKHRKRENQISAYKFYRSSLDSLMKLLYFDIPAKSYTSRKMTVEHFKQLDRLKINRKLKRLTQYLYTSGQRQMDKLFISLIEDYFYYSLKGKLIKEGSPEDKFAHDVIKFARNEFKRERKKPNTFINYSSRR